MAKGQKRSNKEVKKPKQEKAAVPAAVFAKGVPASVPTSSKKKG